MNVRHSGPPQIWWTPRISEIVRASRSVPLGIVLSRSASIHTIHSLVASSLRGTSGLTAPRASDPAARLRELEAQQ